MRTRRGRWARARLAVLAILVTAVLAMSAVATNAFGVGERFEHIRDRIELALNPPPDRPTRPTITVTPRPSLTATPTPRPSVLGSGAPPPPTPTPTPVRKPVDVDIVPDPKAVFASELKNDLCAPAGTQTVLAILGLADTSDEFQRELDGRIDEWESYRDSHNGGWGPAAIVEALTAYGASGYEIRAYEARGDALRDSAIAISQTHAPAVLLAWRGAHTWVMSGYRADADPTIFTDAVVSGAYVLDPWYPRVSSIWGPSDPPGTFQNAAEMKRNFLPWKRPEGLYPDRDGKYIVLLPTVPVTPSG